MRKFKAFVTFALAFSCVLLLKSGVYAKNTVTVVIDPGHGGPAAVETNLGACYNGLIESAMNLQTAYALRDELLQYKNVAVYMTRTDDRALSLEERIAFAKSVGADCVVSVHHNASASHLFYGSEIFVPSGQLYAQGYSLASCIMKQWTGAGAVNKGIKTRIGNRGDYYGLIRHGASNGVPTIILEHAYIDNYHDLGSVDEAADWVKKGKQDAAGIADYFGLSKTKTKANVSGKITVKNPKTFVNDDKTGPALVMTVNSYNKATGEVKYTLTALEPESKVYLYGISAATTLNENGLVIPLCQDLYLWGNNASVSGSFYVNPGYAGYIYACCYNNHNYVSNTATALIGY